MDKILEQDMLEEKSKLIYTGKVLPGAGDKLRNGLPAFPYLPSKELVEMVNLSIALERPLLLQGEPGCGKTQLAQAVAFELGLDYFCWNIKSTSRAQDGLYTYDNLARLRDSQLLTLGQIAPEDKAGVSKPESYLSWGELGKAFRSEEKPAVLLIDEIDKAGLDFPNDLLLELEQKRFKVPEIKDEVIAKYPPIIFITSNQEQDLSNAFLRRCLFHPIEFPEQARLIEIVEVHFGLNKDQELVTKAVERFKELRKSLQDELGGAGKQVSTSELIDWFKVLRSHPEDQILSQLQKNDRLPFLGVLLKTWEEHERYLKQLSEQENE